MVCGTREPEASRLVTSRDITLMIPRYGRRPGWPGATTRPGRRRQRGTHALVDLERAGRLSAIVTQNIDGLHQRAGSSPDRVIEIHGSIAGVGVLGLWRSDHDARSLDRVAAGEPDPACAVCGGILKSATIFFGQSLDATTLQTRRRAPVSDCDALIAIGPRCRCTRSPAWGHRRRRPGAHRHRQRAADAV
jgi:NAD-dependent deacetylase